MYVSDEDDTFSVSMGFFKVCMYIGCLQTVRQKKLPYVLNDGMLKGHACFNSICM